MHRDGSRWAGFFFGRSRLQKLLYLLGYLITVYLVVILFLPRLFFSERYAVGSMAFYANSGGEDFERYCDSFAETHARNPHFAKARNIQVLFAGPAIYRLLCPLQPESLGNSFSFLGYHAIKINNADFPRNQIGATRKGRHRPRTIDSVLLHECMHCELSGDGGPFKGPRLQAWLEEGVCELVGAESSYDEDLGMAAMIAGTDDGSVEYRYFTCRIIAEYLVGTMHHPISELVAEKRSYKSLLREVSDYLRQTGSPRPIGNDTAPTDRS
jgi:hypothetical protein